MPRYPLLPMASGAAAAIAVAAAFGAAAQAPRTTIPEQMPAPLHGELPRAGELPGAPQGLAPADLLGAPLENGQGQEIGAIEDVVRDRDSKIHAVVAVGSRLALGQKLIVVPLDQLRRMDDSIVLVPATEGQISMLPAYDPDRYRSILGGADRGSGAMDDDSPESTRARGTPDNDGGRPVRPGTSD